MGECGSRWVCLPRSSEIEGDSAASTALTDSGSSTLSITFLGLRKFQSRPL